MKRGIKIPTRYTCEMWVQTHYTMKYQKHETPAVMANKGCQKKRNWYSCLGKDGIEVGKLVNDPKSNYKDYNYDMNSTNYNKWLN